jgi:hypothetical protein
MSANGALSPRELARVYGDIGPALRRNAESDCLSECMQQHEQADAHGWSYYCRNDKHHE